jgi:hypothetical protein
VIVVAVRWYLRYGLSYRDVEDLLTERGIEVDHVTVYRWVQRFTPLLAEAARFTRHSTGDRWFVDETYVKVNGVWRYVYRAIDQYGQVIDVLLSPRRDAAAARRFFTRALRTLKVTPSEVVIGDFLGRLAVRPGRHLRRPPGRALAVVPGLRPGYARTGGGHVVRAQGVRVRRLWAHRAGVGHRCGERDLPSRGPHDRHLHRVALVY